MQEFSTLTLGNGIRCVHRRVKSPVANIALTVNSGTRDESPEQHGVAHLVEHLLFKGTGRRTAFQINNRLESVGGELNAFTSKEETVIHASSLNRDYTKGVDLLCDMMFNSLYAQREVDKEKEVIIDEINSYKDTPSELIFDDFEELLFAGSTLGRNILGTPKQLKGIERHHLTDYVASNYNTDQIVFSSSSPLSHTQFQQKCEKILGPIPSNPRTNVREKPATQPKFTIERSKRTHQIHTVLGGNAYSLFDDRRVAFSLLINILGGQSSLSRLNQTLRERHALTYNVEANYTPYSDSGIWAIYFGCEADKQNQSMELTLREIDMIRQNRLTPNQLQRAKRQLIGQLAISSDNNENFIMGIAKSLLVFNSFDTNEEIAAKILSISSDELLNVAQDLLIEQNINTLIYR